jgi:hypothetical protein
VEGHGWKEVEKISVGRKDRRRMKTLKRLLPRALKRVFQVILERARLYKYS